MNIEVFYEKNGPDPVELLVKVHDTHSAFYHQTITVKGNGHIKFYCDWPYGTKCYLDFSTNDPNILTDNYITITKFVFDDFWQSPNLVFRGQNIPSSKSEHIDSESMTSSSIFYTGSLRYDISRPIIHWTL